MTPTQLDAWMKPRKCAYCGRPKGTMAFRFYRSGEQQRDYFHPGCFDTFKAELDALDKAFWLELRGEK